MGINIPVDFTGVEGGASVRAPEGDYAVVVKKLEKKNAKNSGNPMLVCTFEFLTGPDGVKGKRIIDRHILVKDSLWTLRNMMEAMGYSVPSGPMKLKEEMLVGKKVGVTVIDGEEHKGKIKSEIADYIPLAAVGNIVAPASADALDAFEGDDDETEDDGLAGFDTDDEPEEEIEQGEMNELADAAEEEEDSFSMDEEEEETEEEEVALSFDASDVESAKAPELKAYVKEATEAGWELDLGTKPKVSEVKAALTSIFDTEDEEEDAEMDEFSLDDV